MAQMADKVRALPKAEREALLGEVQLPILIPTDVALAMKASAMAQSQKI